MRDETGAITGTTTTAATAAVTTSSASVLPATSASAGGTPLANDSSPAVSAALHHMEQLQQEMDALRMELNLLRRRDETLNFHLTRIDEELRLAARLQQDFLPKELPEVGPVRFHTLFRPAGYVSGDLYDVMRLDETHVGFYMADAVGHGVPAALLTMFIKQALATKEIFAGGYRLIPPGEALARLNQTLVEQNLAHATFVTALYGIVDTVSLEVTIARAGHPAPMILRADGKRVDPLQPDGGLLGIFPGETYDTATAQLSPGDRLLVYTDGIELAFGGEPIDAAQLAQELASRSHLTSEQLLHDFCDHLDAQLGSLTPKDDVTAILVDVLKSPTAAPLP
jgi:serine phosphatase RsbU (regulator of sigma subunit)